MASSMETEPRSPSRPFIDANATRCECELHGFSNSLSIESRDITGLTLFCRCKRKKDKEGLEKEGRRNF